jgi:hypothetical protein
MHHFLTSNYDEVYTLLRGLQHYSAGYAIFQQGASLKVKKAANEFFDTVLPRIRMARSLVH